MRQIILASASPRRKELMEQIGLPFIVMPATKEELISSDIPSRIVSELSLQKASEIAELLTEEAIIIGSDTMVALGNKIMGKPKDEKDAIDMLTCLQGTTHTVYTGVTLFVTGVIPGIHTFYEQCEVTMYPMTPAETADYVATGEPMDKAGSYAIQGKGAVYIKQIKGEYNTVVGLPIGRVYQELKPYLSIY
ncbi:MAG: Maf family protein [Lachnospiraceae bacterium]